MPMLSMAKLINTWRHSERATPVNYFPLCFINFNKSHTLTFSCLWYLPLSLPSFLSSPVLYILFSPNTSQHCPPLFIFLYTSCLFFSPHPGWSGSQRSVWSSEYSYWTPAGQRCQPPLPEQQIHGTVPYWSAGPVHWGKKNGQRLKRVEMSAEYSIVNSLKKMYSNYKQN